MKLTNRVQKAVSTLLVPCSLYCIWVSISADVEWYTGKHRMYDETHKIYIAKYGLYTHGSLFGWLYLGVNISIRT